MINLKKVNLVVLLGLALVVFAGVGTALALPTTLGETTLSSGGTINSTSVILTDDIDLKAGNTIVIELGGGANEERVGVSAYVSATKTVTLSSGLTKTHANGVVVRATNTAGSTFEHDATDSDNFQGVTEPITTGGASVPVSSGPHGRFTTNTNGCGRCHQLHRAPTQRLLRFAVAADKNPIYNVCTYCHSFNGQSTYDVKDGMIWDTYDGSRYATNGGGFEKMLVVEGKPQVATLSKASSSHQVAGAATYNGDGTVTYIKFNAPGGFAENDGHVELKCSSCHQPHGTKNSRLLVTTVKTKSPDGLSNISRETSSLGIKVIARVNNPFGDEKTEYNEEIATFCGACHYDYVSTNASSKSGTYDNTKYRHKMKMSADSGLNDTNTNDGSFGYSTGKMILPLASVDNNGKTGAEGGNPANTVICLTCHYAHGTFTKVDGIKTYDDLSLNSSTKLNTIGGFETPKNLRLDNRGVCQNCHNRTASTVKPVLVNVLDPAQAGTVLYGDTGSLLASKASSPNATTISIRFDQYMWKKGQNTSDGIENPSNYALTLLPSTNVTIGSAVLSPDGRTVVLTTASGMASGNYSLTVTNVKDLNFNPIDTTSSNNVATFTK